MILSESPVSPAAGYLQGVAEAFIKRAMLVADPVAERTGHPWDLPAVTALADGLELHPKVTYLIGENGTGKSTVLTAIALAAGMSAEGGSSNYAFPAEGEKSEAYAFSRRPPHTSLAESIRLVRGARQPRTDFLLRAESMFVAATTSNNLAGTHSPRTVGGRYTSSHTAKGSLPS